MITTCLDLALHRLFDRRWTRTTNVLMTLLLLACVSLTQAQSSEEVLTIDLTISYHLFIPAHLVVPANTRFRLRVINQDRTPEEFESAALNREKVIMGASEGIIFLGPLAPGEYSFFGEFNPRTAQGKLIAEIQTGQQSHD